MRSKTIWILPIALLAGLVVSAQDETPGRKVEKNEEIIIRKKGDKVEKMTIVVDGDEVTINGKPVDQFENKDVIIMKGRSGGRGMAPMVRRFYRNGDGLNVENETGEKKAMLGVMTEKADNGAKITAVTKNSAAEKSGLQKDDIITKVGSTSITDPASLSEAIRKYKPNEKVDITYKRNNKESKVSATLGESEVRAYSFNFNDEDFDFNMPVLPDLDGMELMMQNRPRIGLQIQDVEEGKGVNVQDVDENSPASKAGLKEGDIITQINGRDIDGVDDLKKSMKELKPGDSAKLTYKRNGATQTTEVRMPKKLKTADL